MFCLLSPTYSLLYTHGAQKLPLSTQTIQAYIIIISSSSSIIIIYSFIRSTHGKTNAVANRTNKTQPSTYSGSSNQLNTKNARILKMLKNSLLQSSQ